MHLFTTEETIRTSECDLLPGTYVMEDLHSAQFMLAAQPGKASIAEYKFTDSAVKHPKTILIVRPGVYGDLLLMTPTIRALQDKYPDAVITVATFSRYQSILIGVVNSVIDYPVRPDDLKAYDAVYFMERIIEGNPLSKETPAVDLFSEKIGLILTNKKLEYTILDRELEWANARYPRTEKKRIGIHVAASTACRSYPQSNLVKLIIDAAQHGYEVYLIGAPGQMNGGNQHGITNLMLEGLDIRQSIAAMNTCDVIVAPDSVMLHVAGALGKKAIGLFGPIKWQNRVVQAPTVYCIQGHTECEYGPCGHNANPIEGHFPSYCPTRKNGFCALMAQINPDRVLAKINQLIK
jgi:ADP-heptose:LPS heptosyltransferase